MNRDAYLFVYGSLRGESGHPLSRRLSTLVRRRESASVRGRLLDLGAYPGLWLDPGFDEIVVGELLELPGGPDDPDARELWAELDAYEDVAPPPPVVAEYARIRLPVEVAKSLDDAWGYQYIGATEGRPVIPCGDWLAHLQTRGG